MFPGTETVALVMSRDRPHLSFELNLLSSDKTYDYPRQSWRFQSQYALRDYTGVYFIKLIPCAADQVGSEEVQLIFFLSLCKNVNLIIEPATDLILKRRDQLIFYFLSLFLAIEDILISISVCHCLSTNYKSNIQFNFFLVSRA